MRSSLIGILAGMSLLSSALAETAIPDIDRSKIPAEKVGDLERALAGDARAPAGLANALIQAGYDNDQDIIDLYKVSMERGNTGVMIGGPVISEMKGRHDLSLKISKLAIDAGLDRERDTVDKLFRSGRLETSDYAGYLTKYQLARYSGDLPHGSKIMLLSILPGNGMDAALVDIEEELPFGKGKSYKETRASCRYEVHLINNHFTKVAFEDAYGTVMGVQLQDRDVPGKEMTIQGNIGLSVGYADEYVLEGGQGYRLEFVSMESKSFPSRTAAQDWVTDGNCKIDNIGNIKPAGFMGELMWETDESWSNLADRIVVTAYTPET